MSTETDYTNDERPPIGLRKKEKKRQKNGNDSETARKRTPSVAPKRPKEASVYAAMSGAEADWIVKSAKIRQREIAKLAGISDRTLRLHFTHVTIPHVTLVAIMRAVGGKQWLAAYRTDYRKVLEMQRRIDEGLEPMGALEL